MAAEFDNLIKAAFICEVLKIKFMYFHERICWKIRRSTFLIMLNRCFEGLENFHLNDKQHKYTFCLWQFLGKSECC